MNRDHFDEDVLEAIETLGQEDGYPFSPQLLRICSYGDRGYSRRLACECAQGEIWVFWNEDLIIPAVYLVPAPEEQPGDKLIFPYVDDAAPRRAQYDQPAPIVDSSGANRMLRAAEFLDGLVGPTKPAILIIDNFETFRTLEGERTAEAVHAWAEKNNVLIVGIDYKSGDPLMN